MNLSNPWLFFQQNDIKELQKKYHPDRHGGTKEASELFARIQEAYQKSLTPPVKVGKYPLYSLIESGDLRDVYLTDGIIKVPRIKSKSANRLISKEIETLRDIHEKANGGVFSKLFPKIIDSFEVDGKLCVVQPSDENTSLACVARKYPDGIDGRHISWIYNRALNALGFLHNCGYIHGAISPWHVLINDNHLCSLSGIIHTVNKSEILGPVPTAIKHWYATNDKKPTENLDIRFLSKTMLSLADKNIPRKLKAFIQGAPLTNKGAFELVDDFKEVVSSTYGPPKFVKLEL